MLKTAGSISKKGDLGRFRFRPLVHVSLALFLGAVAIGLISKKGRRVLRDLVLAPEKNLQVSSNTILELLRIFEKNDFARFPEAKKIASETRAMLEMNPGVSILQDQYYLLLLHQSLFDVIGQLERNGFADAGFTERIRRCFGKNVRVDENYPSSAMKILEEVTALSLEAQIYLEKCLFAPERP